MINNFFSCFAAQVLCIVSKDAYLDPSKSQGKDQPLSLDNSKTNIVIFTHEQSSCLMMRLMYMSSS